MHLASALVWHDMSLSVAAVVVVGMAFWERSLARQKFLEGAFFFTDRLKGKMKDER